jgi:hypothetical protein
VGRDAVLKASNSPVRESAFAMAAAHSLRFALGHR